MKYIFYGVITKRIKGIATRCPFILFCLFESENSENKYEASIADIK